MDYARELLIPKSEVDLTGWVQEEPKLENAGALRGSCRFVVTLRRDGVWTPKETHTECVTVEVFAQGELADWCMDKLEYADAVRVNGAVVSPCRRKASRGREQTSLALLATRVRRYRCEDSGYALAD